ncbi:unnamed protein product, partial [Choristocarpus tenellus]
VKQLENQRYDLARELAEAKAQVNEVEKEVQAHSRQSAIGPDGRINPARARKKRRLNEDLETLLEVMEVKRTALSGVDDRLVSLAGVRAQKDEEMKGLERSLVEVLVEQQKKLLRLLSEVSQQQHNG